MTAILDHLPHPAGMTAPDLLLGSLVLLVAAVLAFAMRRRSASERHLVWLLGVAGLGLVPAIALAFPSWNILPPLGNTTPVPAADAIASSPIPGLAETDQAAPLAPQFEALPISPPSMSTLPQEIETGAVPPLTAELPDTPSRWWGAFAMVWVAVTVFLLLRLIAGNIAISLATTRASKSVSPGIASDVAELGERLGLRRRVDIYLEEGRTMPMSCGFVRGAIILPAEAEEWEPGQIRSVLLHELAHVKRRDPLLHAAAKVVGALHWFNPLVWLASSRLEMERERACDDLAIETGLVHPIDYAQHLVSIVSGNAATPSRSGLAFGEHAQIRERLEAILAGKTKSRIAVSTGVVTIGVAIALALATPLALLRAASPEDPDNPGPPQPEEVSEPAAQPGAIREFKPKAVYRAAPKMDQTLRKHAPATVTISLVVDEEGNVTRPVVEKSSDARFDQAALEAIRKWEFQPGERDDRPVAMEVKIPIHFRAAAAGGDGDLGHGYRREGDAIFFKGKRIDQAGKHDLEKFAVIVGHELKLCSEVDAASFQPLASDYARDKNHVYYKWISGPRFWVVELDGADPESFEPLGLALARDKNHVWREDRILEGSDPESLQVLFAGRVYKDSKNVWFNRSPIAGADPETFERIGQSYFYRDAQRVYWMMNVVKVLDGADPGSFKVINNNRGEDQHGAWSPSGRIREE